eukprot:c11298_g2_i1.p1 GENE.c11298_g2_i1~~c11298_g2_i1.p1  ORF type:complete len:104 (+),score=4.88 c11298_g2_i1:1-312(+)
MRLYWCHFRMGKTTDVFRNWARILFSSPIVHSPSSQSRSQPLTFLDLRAVFAKLYLLSNKATTQHVLLPATVDVQLWFPQFPDFDICLRTQTALFDAVEDMPF